MKKSKFTDSQIMDVVKRVEAGFGVPDICQEMGISTATFYNHSKMLMLKDLTEQFATNGCHNITGQA
jgi:hypothetical protein